MTGLKMDYFLQLKAIAAVFEDRFAGMEWCIAGGAIRDTLLGIQPKDYDLFVLGADPAAVLQACSGLTPKISSWRNQAPSSPAHIVDNYDVYGQTVQVMVMENVHTVEGLLHSFDWNICKFALEGEELIKMGKLPVAGDTLVLDCCPRPGSTLRRGKRFAEKFDMALDADTEDFIKSQMKPEELARHG
jgi:hypothetical protein